MRMVRERPVYAKQYDSDFPPEGLLVFQAWLTIIVEGIPTECQSAATIEWTSVSGYDGSYYAQVEISYERPETEVEQHIRERNEQLTAVMRLNEKRVLLEKLKRELSE